QVRQRATHPGGSARRAVAVVRRVSGVCAGSGCCGWWWAVVGVSGWLGGSWPEVAAGAVVPSGAGGVGRVREVAGWLIGHAVRREPAPAAGGGGRRGGGGGSWRGGGGGRAPPGGGGRGPAGAAAGRGGGPAGAGAPAAG